MKTTNAFQRYTCAAAAFLLLATACSKKDNDVKPPEPTGPVTYLIETITTTADNTTKTDSFVYNNKQQLITIYIPQKDRGPEFTTSYHLTYDDAGKVSKTTTMFKGAATAVGTPTWKDGKVAVLEQSAGATGGDRNWVYEFNSQGQATLIGSKDSLFAPGIVRYFEYTYEGKDVIKQYAYTGPKTHDPQQGNTYTYKYDKGPNPFYAIYKNNPYVHFYSELTSYQVLPSEHNLTYFERGGTIYNFENTYDQQTGLLLAQKATATNGSVVYVTSAKFKYVRIQH
ncbi:hypothetical protein [Chitinophaga qingshengii]|uniref:DUF4595 domain-containing protein n=1 Tax=Chitinophaga qingshengii TaxID=1569794 RepID=A0ABR7TR63_9BACT|nr:hypothetical protein [Chitinophaga qingshengii]MBC9932478.1 hypothetical protein [Chitinophaga qingshengii]